MSAASLPADVVRVLGDAFGGAPIEDVTVLRGGRSGARVVAVRVSGSAWVVRAPDPARPQHAERSAREMACMKLASDRGIGPELRHVDHASGITVTARIEDVLGGPARASAPGRLERLATTVRTLHEGPSLPGAGSLAAILAHFDGALRAHRPYGVPDALERTLREAITATRGLRPPAPCHNDLNPANVLETPERVYLVDWETAGEGDPFVDLAQLSVFGSLDVEGRAELLARYLRRAPTAREHAHATLARVIALGFYAVAFTVGAVLAGEGSPEDVASPRPLRELVLELAQGRAQARELGAALQKLTLAEARSDAHLAAMREVARP